MKKLSVCFFIFIIILLFYFFGYLFYVPSNYRKSKEVKNKRKEEGRKRRLKDGAKQS